MRSAMLAYELAERGHEVLWWTSSFDHFGKNWLSDADQKIELNKKIKVQLIHGLGYRKNISLRRIIDHKLVAAKFLNIIRNESKPQAIISSLPTLDLAYASYRYARKNRVPYIVDVRDPWPDAILNAIPVKAKKIVKLLMRNEYRKAKSLLSGTNYIVSVSDSFMNWALSYAGRDRKDTDKVFYIGYEKDGATEGNIAFDDNKELPTLGGNLFIVLYVGTITSRHHNPTILIEAARRLSNYNDIHFVIAGDGEFMGAIKERARSLDNVHLTGWLNQNQISFLLSKSAVGICPSSENSTLMTNKFFSYLSAGMPVLASYAGDIRRIIESRRVGFYYKSDDLDLFIERLLKLKTDRILYDEMSRNCRDAYEDLFESSKIYKKYADYTESVVRSDSAIESRAPKRGKDQLESPGAFQSIKD